MCYFITIGVPANRSDDVRRHVPRGMQFLRIQNPALAKAMGSEHETFILTTGDCSCNLYRPPGESDDNEQSRIDRLQKKYAKKGWSESKIQRAIGSRRESTALEFVGLRDNVGELLVQMTAAAGRIGIVVNWYSGLIDDEKITIREVHSTTADKLRSRGGNLEEDTLIWLRAVYP